MNTKKNNDTADFDFFSLTIQENEWRINRTIGIIAMVSWAVMVLCYLLSIPGIFTLDTGTLLFLSGVMGPFSLFSYVTGSVRQVKKEWVKYALMLSFWVTVTLLFSYLSMHATLIFCIPVLLSLLYSNRTFSLVTAILGVVFMLLGHIFCVRVSIVTDPLVTTLYRSLVFGFAPRFLQYVVICIIAAFITRNNSQMMDKGYYYVKQTRELLEDQRSTHYETVKNLATITENKSKETGEHISRVFEYMRVIAKHIGLSEEDAYDVAMASMLHDVGKLRVPEEILNKPGKLDPEEFEIIKNHASDGKLLLSNTGNSVLNIAAVIADEHHERWDGKGYHGQKGDEINRYAQLMSVIDVFDALTSVRCYKPAWSLQEAYDEIVRGRGTQFSPLSVDTFVECFEQIAEIYRQSNPSASTENGPLQQL